MFLRFVIGALKYRKQRLLLAFAALAVAATLATVLFDIYGTVERRIRDEFRSYGANIAAVPASGQTVPIELVSAAERLGAEAAPFLVTSGQIDKDAVSIAGFVPARSAAMTPYWHMQGSRDLQTGDCIAGELVASRFKLKIGSTVPVGGAPCTLKGIVSTGGAEDQELLVPFEAAAGMAGIHDGASVIEIRAPGGKVDAIRSALARDFPAADVRTIRSVATTESNVVLELRASVFLLTVLILSITTLCVSSSFSEMVIERSKEIGIMKALGAAERNIAAFFVSESAALAAAATLIGYVAGMFAAAGIGREIFGGTFHPQINWLVFGGVGAVMLLVAAIATAIPAARIWHVHPAVILRGE
jgi:putative ABC transport system permease protein